MQCFLGVAALLYLRESKFTTDPLKTILKVLLLLHFISIHLSPDEIRSAIFGAMLLECCNLPFDILDVPLHSFSDKCFWQNIIIPWLVGLQRFGCLQ